MKERSFIENTRSEVTLILIHDSQQRNEHSTEFPVEYQATLDIFHIQGYVQLRKVITHRHALQ
jgi:hypothetical protein